MFDIFMIFLILLSGVDLSITVVFIERYISTKTNYFILLAFLTSFLQVPLFYYVITKSLKELASNITIIKILSVLMIFLYSVYFLKNKITLKEILGIVFGTLSIILLA